MKMHRFIILAAFALSGLAHAERIKDIASVQGVRINQLVGYGLVVGLDGTGDRTTQTPFTVQSIYNMLVQLGVNLPVDTYLITYSPYGATQALHHPGYFIFSTRRQCTCAGRPGRGHEIRTRPR